MAVLAICIAQHWLYRYVYGIYIEVVKFAVIAVRFNYFANHFTVKECRKYPFRSSSLR
jgi:hypothetical protein